MVQPTHLRHLDDYTERGRLNWLRARLSLAPDESVSARSIRVCFQIRRKEDPLNMIMVGAWGFEPQTPTVSR